MEKRRSIRNRRAHWVIVGLCLNVLLEKYSYQVLKYSNVIHQRSPLHVQSASSSSSRAPLPTPMKASFANPPFEKFYSRLHDNAKITMQECRHQIISSPPSPSSPHDSMSSLSLLLRCSYMGIMYLASLASAPTHPSLQEEVKQTFVANFKLVNVSLKCACSGLIITNMSVFELPPREFCSRYVSYCSTSAIVLTLPKPYLHHS